MSKTFALAFVVIITAVVGLFTASELPARPVGVPWCAPDTLGRAGRFVANMRRLGSSSAPDWVQMRAKLASMPLVSPNEVFLVQDETLCERASATLDSVFFTSPQAMAVYLARIGDRYAIFPPDVELGEFGYLIHTDSAFHKIGITTY